MASESANAGAKAPSRLAEWSTRRERGSVFLLRVMTLISLRIGRRAGRFLLYFIAAYFFAFAPQSRRHSYAYLRRALGRRPTARDWFRHVLTFASTVHDRVYLVNAQYDVFEISIEGQPLVDRHLAEGRGALLMGAHLGSFEVTRAAGHRRAGRLGQGGFVAGKVQRCLEDIGSVGHTPADDGFHRRGVAAREDFADGHFDSGACCAGGILPKGFVLRHQPLDMRAARAREA